jgi:hypothetical protein
MALMMNWRLGKKKKEMLDVQIRQRLFPLG